MAHRVTIDREEDFILTLSARGSGVAADPPKMEMPRGVRRRHGIKGDSRENQGGKERGEGAQNTGVESGNRKRDSAAGDTN